jgi:hypothetical protein
MVIILYKMFLDFLLIILYKFFFKASSNLTIRVIIISKHRCTHTRGRDT